MAFWDYWNYCQGYRFAPLTGANLENFATITKKLNFHYTHNNAAQETLYAIDVLLKKEANPLMYEQQSEDAKNGYTALARGQFLKFLGEIVVLAGVGYVLWPFYENVSQKMTDGVYPPQEGSTASSMANIGRHLMQGGGPTPLPPSPIFSQSPSPSLSSSFSASPELTVPSAGFSIPQSWLTFADYAKISSFAANIFYYGSGVFNAFRQMCFTENFTAILNFWSNADGKTGKLIRGILNIISIIVTGMMATVGLAIQAASGLPSENRNNWDYVLLTGQIAVMGLSQTLGSISFVGSFKAALDWGWQHICKARGGGSSGYEQIKDDGGMGAMEEGRSCWPCGSSSSVSRSLMNLNSGSVASYGTALSSTTAASGALNTQAILDRILALLASHRASEERKAPLSLARRQKIQTALTNIKKLKTNLSKVTNSTADDTMKGYLQDFMKNTLYLGAVLGAGNNDNNAAQTKIDEILKDIGLKDAMPASSHPAQNFEPSDWLILVLQAGAFFMAFFGLTQLSAPYSKDYSSVSKAFMGFEQKWLDWIIYLMGAIVPVFKGLFFAFDMRKAEADDRAFRLANAHSSKTWTEWASETFFEKPSETAVFTSQMRVGGLSVSTQGFIMGFGFAIKFILWIFSCASPVAAGATAFPNDNHPRNPGRSFLLSVIGVSTVYLNIITGFGTLMQALKSLIMALHLQFSTDNNLRDTLAADILMDDLLDELKTFKTVLVNHPQVSDAQFDTAVADSLRNIWNT